jgi:carbonic anhydrase
MPHTWDPDSLSPSAAVERLLEGNQRFCDGRPASAARAFSADLAERPQWPFAIVLGCSDSRTPV